MNNAKNREVVKSLKGDMIITFIEKDVGFSALTEDDISVERDVIVKEIKRIMYSDTTKSILELLSNVKYTRTVASYSNIIRKNVVPIELIYPNGDTSSSKWSGYFINMDNGNIYHICAGMQKYSKYRYEFHTLYLEDEIYKHSSAREIYETINS